MYISNFKYYRPKTISEALRALTDSDNAAVLAGGTDILVELKQGLRKHDSLISLKGLNELRQIDNDREKVYIGSCVTHNQLVESEIIQRYCPAMSEAASKIGTHQIRNTGTVGGNLCTGASCADLAPPLVMYDAEAIVEGRTGVRKIPLKDFFAHHHRTVLKKGGLLTRIEVPIPHEGTGASFEKYGHRNAASISVASVAVLLRVRDGVCVNSSIVTGACAPTPVLSGKAMEVLINREINEFKNGSELIKKASKAAAGESIPIDDIRGSARYRKELIKVVTERAILIALERALKK